MLNRSLKRLRTALLLGAWRPPMAYAECQAMQAKIDAYAIATGITPAKLHKVGTDDASKASPLTAIATQ